MAYTSKNPRFNSVSIGGTKDASAALQVQSTTQGVGLPDMTEAQRDAISTPVEGLVIHNSTTNKINVYTNSAWGEVNVSVSNTLSVNNLGDAAYTVTDSDGYDVIIVGQSADMTAARTVTLPTATDNNNRRITVIKGDAAAFNVTVDGEGAEVVGPGGALTYTLTKENSEVTLLCDGTEWRIYGASRVVSGKYTPTYSGETGCSGIVTSGGDFYYTRVGELVTVHGYVKMSIGNSTANPSFSIDLPIQPIEDLEDIRALRGSIRPDGGTNTMEASRIRADVVTAASAKANCIMRYPSTTSTASNQEFYLTFAYVITLP
jgi:hypothetical protein